VSGWQDWDPDGLWVIEDCAQAHGARDQGERLGSLGVAGCFSFYGNKILSCGEGGMVTTNNDDIAEKVHWLRRQGMSLTERYRHPEMGYNLRMTEMQGAIGLAQVEKVSVHLSYRDELMDRYYARFLDSPLAHRTQDRPHGSVSWVFPLLVSERDRVAKQLRADGIETRPVFYPLHLQPVYREANSYDGLELDLPVSWGLSRQGLLLPLHCGMRLEDVDLVCNSLLRALSS
jgi:perosamine synthetase